MGGGETAVLLAKPQGCVKGGLLFRASVSFFIVLFGLGCKAMVFMLSFLGCILQKRMVDR